MSRFPEKQLHLKHTLIIIFSVIFLDQATKYIARFLLAPAHSVSILGKFFRLTYVENPGIAFGVQINNKVLFTLLSIIAVMVIFYYLLKLKEHWLMRFSFAIILGGAFGNLIDRFIHGRVVDFFDFDFFNINLSSFKFLFFEFHGYSMDRWPVFNIADIAVSIGMILIILSILFDHKKQEGDSHAIANAD